WSGWPRPCGWGSPSVAPGRSRPAGAVPNSEPGEPSSDQRGKRGPSVLLTGPFGGLTDDVREFLRCPDGLALTRRLMALLRSLCDAGRLTEAEAGLLQLTDLGREFLDLPEAAQLGFLFPAWWGGVDWGDWAPPAELGRLLWHERDSLLQEVDALPP